MNSTDEMTPYGFTYAQAIEALKFKGMVENDLSPTNAYRKIYSGEGLQKDLETMFGEPRFCSIWGCKRRKYIKQRQRVSVHYYPKNDYCDHHLEIIGNRSKRALECKKETEEKKRLEILERIRGYEYKLRYIESEMDYLERRTQRKDLEKIRAERAEEMKRRKLEKKFSVKKKRKSRVGYVYHIFDKDDCLLYVGKSVDVPKRFFYQGGHKDTKKWWVYSYKTLVTQYSSEDSALLAEIIDIKRLNPKHNISRPEPVLSRKPRKVRSTLFYIDHVSKSLVSHPVDTTYTKPSTREIPPPPPPPNPFDSP